MAGCTAISNHEMLCSHSWNGTVGIAPGTVLVGGLVSLPPLNLVLRGLQIAGSARPAPAAAAPEEYLDDGDEEVEKMAPPVDPKGLPRGAQRFSEKYSDDGNSSGRVRPPTPVMIPCNAPPAHP